MAKKFAALDAAGKRQIKNQAEEPESPEESKKTNGSAVDEDVGKESPSTSAETQGVFELTVI